MIYRVQQWVWNKKGVSAESDYRYPRTRTSDQKKSANSDMSHPLGLDMTKIQNFDYLHKLLNPDQFRHVGEPNSTVKPNQIMLGKHVTERKVNIRKLVVEDYVVARLVKNHHAEKTQKPIHAKQTSKTTQQPLQGTARRGRAVQRRKIRSDASAPNSKSLQKRTGTPKPRADGTKGTMMSYKSVQQRRATSGSPIPPPQSKK